MSVAIDTDAQAQEKTEFDAEFESTNDDWTMEAIPICAITCNVTSCL